MRIQKGLCDAMRMRNFAKFSLRMRILRNSHAKAHPCEKIKEQLKAFEDNMMDVSILAEDANAKLQSEQQVTNLYNRVDDLTAAIQGMKSSAF
jgi:hypothetical protein